MALADPPDLAIIAVPTSLHLEVALPLLQQGVPCLVEKPLACTLDDAAALAAFPNCHPGHIVRFSPEYRSFETHRDPSAAVGFIQAERLAAPTGRSGDIDVIMDLMIHDLDLVLHLFHRPVVDLRAIGVSLSADPNRIDIANVRLETGAGEVANLTASRVSRRPVRSLRVFTTSEYWTLDATAGKVERLLWAGGASQASTLALGADDALDAEHDALLATVRGERPFPISPLQGLQAVEFAHRVIQAIASNRGRRSVVHDT